MKQKFDRDRINCEIEVIVKVKILGFNIKKKL